MSDSLGRFRKARFYGRGVLEHLLIPDAFFRRKLPAKLFGLTSEDVREIQDRVSYYNKMEEPFQVPEEAISLGRLSSRHKSSYFYDFRSVMRYFPKDSRVALRFGDVRDVAPFPRIVKTRPIHEPNAQSILLKLNSIRHFRPISDAIPYDQKKDLMVWRGKVKRDHRMKVFESHFGHPLCDLGKTNQTKDEYDIRWNKPFMRIEEQLKYKFILSIEGNEVATNLKWIAQSNSICFMIRPKFESWFMEGRLIGGVHYVELLDDYSDIEEKIEYYLSHPDEASEVNRNLREYYRQFTDPEKELLISLMVVRKYLEMSDQPVGEN
jgi:hypothetical protein